MLFRVAIAVFSVGLVASVVALIPIFTGSEPLPVAVYFAALLAPCGLGLMLIGLWRNARSSPRIVHDDY